MLNNKGQTLKDVIKIICVMFFAVIITMIIYNRNFKSLFEGDTDKKSIPTIDYEYTKVEVKLEKAAKKYYDEKFSSDKMGVIPSVTITATTLIKQDYLDDIKANDSRCTGYVTIKNDKKITYYTYIKCGNYETDGYEKGLDN